MLELGSGAGLTGVAVCHACKPKEYIFTDCHQGVLRRLHANVQRNGLNEEGGSGVSARVEELDWERARDEDLRSFGAETIVAAGTPVKPDPFSFFLREIRFEMRILKRSVDFFFF